MNKIIIEAEKRCSQRLFDDRTMKMAIAKAETHPIVGQLNKAELRGAIMVYKVGFGGRKPSSYNGIPESTHTTLKFVSGEWKIVSAKRNIAPTNDIVEFTLSKEQIQIGIKKATSNIEVI